MTQFLKPWKYQFDEFGTNPSNLVTGELKTLAANHIPFPLNEGLFYAESVMIKPQGASSFWVAGVDYKFVGLDDYITAKTGKEAVSAIEVVNKTWTGVLEITYQCVGGSEGMPVGVVRQLLEAIELAINNNTIDWNTDISNKPTYFPPAPHGHPLESMEQLDLLTQAIRELFNALINRIPMAHTGQHLQEQIDRVLGIVAQMRNALNAVVAVAGSMTLIQDILDQLDALELIASNEKALNANQSSLIGEWNLNTINSVRGLITFIADGTSETETFDFIVAGTATTAPVFTEFAPLRTSSKIMNLAVTRVGLSLRLTVTPLLKGRVKVKYYAVL